MTDKDQNKAEMPEVDEVVAEQTENIPMPEEPEENTVSELEAGEQDKAEDAKALQQKLSAANNTVAQLQDQLLRAQAEVQNVRRRATQDVEKAHKFGLEKFAAEMLPIIDNLERAIEAFGDDEVVKPMREGVEMTLQMFLSGLEKFQIKAVSPKGELFDPALHQAMSMIDAPDVEANSIIEVMQKGYTLHGRLIRPAMVIVAKS